MLFSDCHIVHVHFSGVPLVFGDRLKGPHGAEIVTDEVQPDEKLVQSVPVYIDCLRRVAKAFPRVSNSSDQCLFAATRQITTDFRSRINAVNLRRCSHRCEFRNLLRARGCIDRQRLLGDLAALFSRFRTFLG